MEIVNQNIMTLVEELKSKLLRQRIIKERFRLPMSFEDAKLYLMAAYKVEVERRFREFEESDGFARQLNQVANYLTRGSQRCSMIFSGLCGNGENYLGKSYPVIGLCLEY